MPNRKIEKAVASWTTPHSDSVWSRLEELKSELRVHVGDEQQADWIALGPTLNDDTESRIAPFRVHLIDAPDLAVIDETFGVSDKVRWPVLGLTWFRKIGVHFRNFHSHWRAPGFALYMDRPRITPGG